MMGSHREGTEYIFDPNRVQNFLESRDSDMVVQCLGGQYVTQASCQHYIGNQPDLPRSKLSLRVSTCNPIPQKGKK